MTGSAGYIGSRPVLALKDDGRRPVVIDDLSTGNRNLIRDDVPFYKGFVTDARYSSGLCASATCLRSCTSPGSI